MAMNSKGSRPIAVDEEAYRWSFTGPGYEGRRALLVVQSAHGQGQKLRAYPEGFYNAWHSSEGFPGCFTTCTSAMVRDVIRAARDAGWKPQASGADFDCVWSGGEKVVLRVLSQSERR